MSIETRFLGASGLQVPVLTMGTMTFGGAGRHAPMGKVQVDEATRMVDRRRELLTRRCPGT
jgi:aryl-alcohol dehydrogenase-like predicted oxidoreductase